MARWIEGGVLHLDVELDQSSQDFDVELVGGGSGRLPYYTGAYVVDPRKVEQILETRNKSMREDVTINEIYYSETSNVGGGLTAYIGME
jgi:hypothetical protein